MTAAQQSRPEPPEDRPNPWTADRAGTPGAPDKTEQDPVEQAAEELDVLLELKLQEFAMFYLSGLNKEDLIDMIITDRRAWVQDRRRFMMWLAERNTPVCDMSPEETNYYGDTGEPDEYCVEEIRDLIGREPDEIDIRGYEQFLEFRYNELPQEAIVEWALEMPDR